MKRVMIAAAAVVCGAGIGWLCGGRTYRSAALLEVVPPKMQVRIIYSPPGTTQGSVSVPPAAAVAESYAARILSPRNVDHVLRDPAWPRGMDAAEFRARLSAEPAYGGRIVEVAFEHPDPALAESAVDLVTAASLRVFDEERRLEGARVENLAEMEQGLAARLERLAGEQDEATEGLGATFLTVRQESLTRSVSDLRLRLEELDVVAEDLGDATPDSVRRRRASLGALLERREAEIAAQSGLVEQVAARSAEVEKSRARLDLVRTRRRALEEEGAGESHGILRVLTPAVTATEPATDDRPALATLGGLIALVLVGGGTLTRRR